MKEQYQAFAASALLFLSGEKASIATRYFGNEVLTLIVNIGFMLLAFGILLRGIYCLLPVPLLGDARARFEEAHPDACLLSREERMLLYKRWKKTESSPRE